MGVRAGYVTWRCWSYDDTIWILNWLSWVFIPSTSASKIKVPATNKINSNIQFRQKNSINWKKVRSRRPNTAFLIQQCPKLKALYKKSHSARDVSFSWNIPNDPLRGLLFTPQLYAPIPLLYLFFPLQRTERLTEDIAIIFQYRDAGASPSPLKVISPRSHWLVPTRSIFKTRVRQRQQHPPSTRNAYKRRRQIYVCRCMNFAWTRKVRINNTCTNEIIDYSFVQIERKQNVSIHYWCSEEQRGDAYGGMLGAERDGYSFVCGVQYSQGRQQCERYLFLYQSTVGFHIKRSF